MSGIVGAILAITDEGEYEWLFYSLFVNGIGLPLLFLVLGLSFRWRGHDEIARAFFLGIFVGPLVGLGACSAALYLGGVVTGW